MIQVYLVPSRPGRHAKDGAQYGIEKLEALTKKDFHDNEEFLSSPITLQVRRERNKKNY